MRGPAPGSRRVWLMVGGSTPRCSVSARATASTAPAAPIRWPIIDLIDDSGRALAPSPKMRLTAVVSIWSFSRVLVPWALM